MTIRYQWRGPVDNAALNRLHAEGFDHAVLHSDWAAQLDRHSLGWVCATDGDELVGFVNVAWDGAVHAFLLDTLVTPRVRRQAVGTELVAVAARGARAAAATGCTSTSRITCGPSTSRPVASFPPRPDSSRCDQQASS